MAPLRFMIGRKESPIASDYKNRPRKRACLLARDFAATSSLLTSHFSVNFPSCLVFASLSPITPKPGKEDEVLALVRSRVPNLLKEGLVTDREPVIMRSRDGTIIEVSEWKSREAIDAAHKNPNVLAMWNKFFAVCDCVPLNTLAEAQEMFAGFEPIED